MLFGSGILRGMWVTLKNFVQSYFRKPLEGGLFTVEYPEKKIPSKEKTRNFPFLVYDGKPENLRCTACGICAKECPTQCIEIEKEMKDGKPLRRPAVFNIDLSLCMNCGTCEDVCPFDSIYMDHDFEIFDSDRLKGLLYPKERLLKSNDYFRKIRPSDAAAVDRKRLEAEEKKKAALAAVKSKNENQGKTGESS